MLSSKSAATHRVNVAHSVLVYGGSTVAIVVGVWAFPPTGFDIGLLLVGWFITGIGISVGYHRLLAHRTFEATPIAEFVLLALGSMAGQGPPAYWAVLHRNHHRFSDRPGDPHSPIYGFKHHALRGFLHAHFGWIYSIGIPTDIQGATDVIRDPIAKAVGRAYLWFLALGLAIPAIIGALHFGSIAGAAHGLIWGGAARIILVSNLISSINSVCHLFGSQRYRTYDSSRNNWWLSVISMGESWHNNHHAATVSSAFGHKWWELDIGYLVIDILRRCRLVSEVKVVAPSALKRRVL
jgi:stearoyl-CoA desaturase (Delta-9 desaturase)